MRKRAAYNISYPASAAVVVFGVHLSAQAAFPSFDRKSPANPSRVRQTILENNRNYKK